MQNNDIAEHTCAPEALEPHPLNDRVYADRTELADSFLRSIEEHGILEPIVTTRDDTIISGHRRIEAALQLDMDAVPVKVREFADDLDQRAKLIEFNQQRDKTFSQQMREGAAIKEIEREQAKRRQGTRTDLVENSPRGDDRASTSAGGEFGKTRDKVAAKIGMGSGRTYGMAQTVWQAAQEGGTVAQDEVDKLDRGEQSIYGAYQKVRDQVQPETDTDKSEVVSGRDAIKQDSPATDHEDDRERVSTDDVILSARVETNDDVFPDVLELHVEPGSSVTDVTYGKGVFWKQVPSGRYDLTATDINPARSPDSTLGVDCRDLPHDDGSYDCVVLDPPYREGFYKPESKPSDDDYWISERYGGNRGTREATYHEAVLDMYAAAGEEAHRVLCENGVLIAKMQDEVSRDEQRLTHIEVTNLYEELGFHTKDLFVVVRPDTPAVGRMYEQRRARKSHSYFLVYEKRTDT